MNTYVVLGIGAALLLGAKHAAAAVAGAPVEPLVPAGNALIPASAFPTFTLPSLAPLPSLPSAGYAPAALPPIGYAPAAGYAAPTTLPPSYAPAAAGATLAVLAAPPAAAAPVAQSGSSSFHLSDQATIKLGINGTKQVLKWFQTPVDAPTTALSPDVASAWTQYRVGEYGDYTAWATEQTPLTEVADLDVLNNMDTLSAVESVGSEVITAGSSEISPGLFAGEVGGLESVAGGGAVEATTMASDSISLLSSALIVLGVCAVLVDIGFTLASDKSMVEKVVMTALNAAIIVCMFIPVYGWIIGLVLSLVKMIVGMFLSGQESHEQREAAETARYLDLGVKPFIRNLASVLSPREMYDYLTGWGPCGPYRAGEYVVTISAILRNPANPTEALAIGPCDWYGSAPTYRGLPARTRDDQALLLVEYGVTDMVIEIAAGISEDIKALMNQQMDDMATKKLRSWAQMWDYGLDLNDMDAIAQEQRRQPRLMAIAAMYGFSHWRDLVQYHLQDYWTRYIVTSRGGSLNHFAALLGYPGGWVTLRDAVMESYGVTYDRITRLEFTVLQLERSLGWTQAAYVDPLSAYTWGGAAR